MILLKFKSKVFLIFCLLLEPVLSLGADFEFSYLNKQNSEKPSVIAAKGSIKLIEDDESSVMTFEKSDRRSGYYKGLPEQLFNIKFNVIDKKLHIWFAENHNIDEWENLIQITLATSILEMLGYADKSSEFPVPFKKVLIKTSEDEFTEYDQRMSFLNLLEKPKKRQVNNDEITYTCIKGNEDGVRLSKVIIDAKSKVVRKGYFYLGSGSIQLSLPSEVILTKKDLDFTKNKNGEYEEFFIKLYAE